jgi:hypothetical protein
MPHLTAEALYTDAEGLAVLRTVLRGPRAEPAGVTDIAEARRTSRRSTAVPPADDVAADVRPRRAAVRP